MANSHGYSTRGWVACVSSDAVLYPAKASENYRFDAVTTAEGRMPNIYEDVPIGDMSYDADEQLYQYQCPCGDLFEITLEELWDGDDVAHCPSCTLKVRVIFDKEQLPPLPPAE